MRGKLRMGLALLFAVAGLTVGILATLVFKSVGMLYLGMALILAVVAIMVMDDGKFEFAGKKIKNPAARFVLVYPEPLLAGIFVAIAGALLPFVCALHPILRTCGRKGFFREKDGKKSICIDREVFQKV